MSDVLVVGSIHLDRMVSVAAFPQPGETIVSLDTWTQLGGKGANQAVASAQQHPTRLVACVGRDRDGEQARALLTARGVSVVLSESATQATGSSVALIDAAGENMGIIAPAANTDLTPAAVTAALDTPPALVLCQWETPPDTLSAVLEAARRRGIPTLLNAAPWREDYRALLPLADHVIVNAVEAAAWLGRPVDPHAQTLPFDHPSVTVTLGADGAAHYARGHLRHRQPAPRVQAQSTHGAGDRFVGTLAAHLAQGRALPDALSAASAAAATFVQTLHKAELHTELQPHR
ncbi:PfkB family carbohydrate kinase [Deinococcus radiotolerans]|uniref:Ribokinase n=1 Tax=Deinococcus radiotolerans TaxID=1309407 RepID=A0ABQ2FKS9_9DEIO|nr:PfkB family carbohydrate kinase [Deinococcus radiotolerans]GGK99514.1 ribokinase [Deinococcus radiotolerans]